ncbi:hypothetical protein [Nocardioides marmorisolisilvae]|nr:hypothetical protein [Nocardioides marmorisolisilvae]
MHKTNLAGDFHAIDAGSPALIPMLWGLRLALGHWVWGKMDS